MRYNEINAKNPWFQVKQAKINYYVHVKIWKITGNDRLWPIGDRWWLVTTEMGYNWLKTAKELVCTSLEQLELELHVCLFYKKLVRLLVALFGGKKLDRTGPENTTCFLQYVQNVNIDCPDGLCRRLAFNGLLENHWMWRKMFGCDVTLLEMSEILSTSHYCNSDVTWSILFGLESFYPFLWTGDGQVIHTWPAEFFLRLVKDIDIRE